MKRAPLTALLAVPLAIAAVAPAAAAAGAPLVAERTAYQVPTQTRAPLAIVSITGITPMAPRASEPVVLSGRVTNTSATPLADLSVYLRVDRDRVRDRVDIARVAGDPDFRPGTRRSDVAARSRLPLPPGLSMPWRLRLSPPALGMTRPGVYVVGAEAVATLAGGGPAPVAAARTLLPWDVPTDRTVPVALVWPVAAQPSMLPNDTLASPALERDVAAGGPLRTVVATGARAAAPLTWLVDPDVLDATGRMADGYSVATGPGGASRAGSPAGVAAAGSFLAALREAATPTPSAGSETLLLPFADADPTGLAHQGPAGAALVADAVGRARTAATASGLTAQEVTAWPVSGDLDGDTLDALRAARTEVVLGSAVTGTASPAPAAAGANPTVVRTDDGIATGLEQQRAFGLSAAQVRQQRLADTALAAVANPSAPPEPLVLAPPPRWRPTSATAAAVLQAWREAPWVQPVALSAAVRLGGGSAAVPTVARARPALSAVAAAQVLDLDRRVSALAAVTGGPGGPLLRPLQDAVLRGASAAWRYAPRAAAAYLDRSNQYAAFRTAQLRVLTPDRVTLSSSVGRFPLTVANELPVPATVLVSVVAANPDRLQVSSPTALVRLAAGTKATVLVDASASANGATPVSVRLLTPAGTPYNRPRALQVVATDYGLVGWIVIAIAGSVLLVMAVVRTVRRVRSRRTRPDPTVRDPETAAAGT